MVRGMLQQLPDVARNAAVENQIIDKVGGNMGRKIGARIARRRVIDAMVADNSGNLPEPGAGALLALGVAMLGARRQRTAPFSRSAARRAAS